jgi:hypothetical protein
MTANSKIYTLIITVSCSKVEVVWVVTLCSVTVGHQRFRSPCCLHLQVERWCPTTTLHGVTIQKTSTWNITAVKVSKLASCWGEFGQSHDITASYRPLSHPQWCWQMSIYLALMIWKLMITGTVKHTPVSLRNFQDVSWQTVNEYKLQKNSIW